jgi:predicted Zn-dependent protease
MPTDRYIGFTATLFEANPDTQVTALREFISRNPGYAPPYNNLAYALWARGDRTAALEAAKRQVELNPNAPNPHDTYAEILQWGGSFAEATAAYRRAAATAPRFPEAYAGLAEVEALQGRYDQARSYLNQAIANAWTPQQKLAYMRAIAGTYALQGGSDAALVAQYEAIAREATAQQNPLVAAIANLDLAIHYAAAGNATASHLALAAGRAASPEVPWNVHYSGVIAHGLLKHWGPANEALIALKARATTPPAPPTWIAAAEGFLLTQQGRAAEGLRILTAADTTNVLVIQRIAEAHAALGNRTEAAAWNARIGRNYAINLVNIPAADARRRAR